MFATLTVDELKKVLDKTNTKYNRNLVLTVRSAKPKGTRFILRVKDKNGPGARSTSDLTKQTNFACFHAYGDFIDNLFEMYPEARIRIRGEWWRKNNWYWKDFLVDRYNAIYMSQLCECS